MQRCAKCILPENYPGITFDENGTCSYCRASKERRYLGDEALQEKIDLFLKMKKRRNKKYDCVLGLSGGRDSSYLLYYLVKILNLRVIAYSVDNGFIPNHTILNMKEISDRLNVELVIEKHEYLEKCLKHHILSWMHRPSAAMVGMICTGCKLNIDIGMLNFAEKNQIPVIITGGTPFEGKGYKLNLMRSKPNSRRASSLILRYVLHIVKNPYWIMNHNCLAMQIREYYHHYYRRVIRRKRDILTLTPFWSFIRWEEDKVVSTLENELNWYKHPDLESTWRTDCEVVPLKLYLYKKTLGFNDIVDGLSCLIRDNQIRREEALERLRKEEEIPEKIVKEIFAKLELDFSDLKNCLEKRATK